MYQSRFDAGVGGNAIESDGKPLALNEPEEAEEQAEETKICAR